VGLQGVSPRRQTHPGAARPPSLQRHPSDGGDFEKGEEA